MVEHDPVVEAQPFAQLRHQVQQGAATASALTPALLLPITPSPRQGWLHYLQSSASLIKAIRR